VKPAPPKSLALTKLMIWGRRAALDRTPADVGLAYEDVAFLATDVRSIRGWFVPREDPEPGPAVVFVHGWLWNRLGNAAGHVPFEDKDVDFLPATRALHDAGYHVLLIDLRNHGESQADPPITYGPYESRDYAGAVEYLRRRPDVDDARIGALGCSMGANTAIYGTPSCQPVKALLAVQPAVLPHFNANFAREMFGPLGPSMLKPVDVLYRAWRRPMPKRHNPAVPARHLGATVVQYVQGTGDPWGTMEDVEAMAAATPGALPVVRFPSAGRYEGYRYVNEAVDDVAGFFKQHL
jgi:pimeloyl-ACP methyl ester carboxylesterase